MPNMTRALRLAMSVAPVILASCGGSTTPTAPATGARSLTGTVTDPIGDALVVPGVPTSPDLAGATLEVDGGNLTITVSYAPGTMSQGRTLFLAFLDTDENPATGNPGIPAASGVADADQIGWEYQIGGVDPVGSGRASVLRATGSGNTLTLNSVPVTFPNADQIRVVVPMSALGNDDGRMTFKIIGFPWLDSQPPSATAVDDMPDLAAAPGAVR